MGWCFVKIADIGRVKGGKRLPQGSQYSETPTPYPYIRVSDFKTGTIDVDNLRYISEEIHKVIARYTIENTDVYISIAGTIGLVGRVPPQLSGANLTENAAKITPEEEIDPNYLYRVLSSDIVQRQIQRETIATTQPKLALFRIESLSIPLPPLNEQRRIVAKIEALKAHSDRVKEELEAIPTLLDQFRQSVLSAAFRGDLTADWREKNPDVEPASVLLERIRAERDKRYERECQKSKAEGRKKPTPFKQNLEHIELSSLPTIPKKWEWERLVNISNIVGGVTKGRKFGTRKTIMLPYLRVANVQDGFLDLNEIKEIEVLPEDLAKYQLEYGDILFTEGGDRDKLGRGTVWRNNIENCIHQNHVYRARLYYLGVSCDYISLFAKSEYAKSYFFASASQTVNLASINITSLGKLPLPIPPKKEQQEIVRRIETFFKTADQVEQQYQQAKSHLDQLNQSILAKAFRGELVSQDPNDEPASVLLERIRAEREKLDTKKKAKGKTKKKSRKAKPEPAEPEQLNLPGFE